MESISQQNLDADNWMILFLCQMPQIISLHFHNIKSQFLHEGNSILLLNALQTCEEHEAEMQTHSQTSIDKPEKNGRDNVILSSRDSEKCVQSVEYLKK